MGDRQTAAEVAQLRKQMRRKRLINLILSFLRGLLATMALLEIGAATAGTAELVAHCASAPRRHDAGVRQIFVQCREVFARLRG